MKAIIIGSGIAGLACSIRLAEAGFRVEVYEANSYVGGKLTQFEENGFRFDAGPSLFTLPELVDELFVLAGQEPREKFNYKKLDLITKYFYEDGIVLNSYTEKSKLLAEFQQKLNLEPQVLNKILASSQEKYELTNKLFLESSLHKSASYLTKHAIKALLSLGKLNISESMNDFNSRMLKVNQKAVQYFNRYATYNGSNPYQASAVLSIIPYLEHNLGAYFPIGGMHEIIKSLYQLAVDLGVEFYLNHAVQEIIVQKNKVTGVRITQAQNAKDGVLKEADLVISNMDVVPTYKKLLPKEKHPETCLSQPRSSSALIFYWCVAKSFPELELHNIFFSGDYKKEFEYIFQRKQVFDDPTVYLNISCKQQVSDAPAGKENWFVMVNVPSNEGQNWDSIIQETRTNILKKLSRILKVDLQNLIENESILEPRIIEQKTSSFQGALYGSSSNNLTAAFLRHPNFSQDIKGLYFCGGSVHPGGGIPLCLQSAKITANLITNKFAK